MSKKGFPKTNPMKARGGAYIFCNHCLQRFFLVLEPAFSKAEVPQPKPQLPVVCPFCGEHEIEQEDDVVEDAMILSEVNFRRMVRP